MNIETLMDAQSSFPVAALQNPFAEAEREGRDGLALTLRARIKENVLMAA